MKPIITLKRIQKYWDLPELAALDNEALCCALLHDDCNSQLAKLGSTIQNLGASTLGKFVNGNFRDRISRAFANVDTTKKIMDRIRVDAQVPYRISLNMPPKSCRESMLHNIRS